MDQNYAAEHLSFRLILFAEPASTTIALQGHSQNDLSCP